MGCVRQEPSGPAERASKRTSDDDGAPAASATSDALSILLAPPRVCAYTRLGATARVCTRIMSVARHDPKQQDATLLLHTAATYTDHIPSPERRSSTDAKCRHQSCYEQAQQSARELQVRRLSAITADEQQHMRLTHVYVLQKLRDAVGALKLEKDKEIAFLRDQLAAYTLLTKSPARPVAPAPPPPPVPIAVAHCTVGTQTSATSSLWTSVRSPAPQRTHAITPSIFSVTTKGVVRTVRLDRQASLKSAHALAMIAEAATAAAATSTSVADRVADALTDPVLSLPYLHSPAFAADLVALSTRVCDVLEAEPRCLRLESPVHVFGDIHGNYSDLRFFADTMWPLGVGLTPGRLLFLGDYVDRGASSLECVAYLFAQKLLYPTKVLLLRGNHETRAINGLEAHYGAACLLAQCKARFGDADGHAVWHEINHAFDRLPLAAVVDNDLFCVHGGVPRPLDSDDDESSLSHQTLDAIEQLPRIARLDVLDAAAYAVNTPLAMVSDMLWSDPVCDAREHLMDSRGFGASLRGGVAVSFGARAIEQFLDAHGFSRIVRAHEAKRDGVAVSKSARVLTVFSTSKDHGLGDDATCGCLLVDHGKILAINRSLSAVPKQLQLQRRRSVSCQREPPPAPLLLTPSAGGASATATHRQPSTRRAFQLAAVMDLAWRPQSAPDSRDGRTSHSSDGSDSTDDEDDQVAPSRRVHVVSESARSSRSSSTIGAESSPVRAIREFNRSTELAHELSSSAEGVREIDADECDDEADDNNQHDDDF